MKGVLLRERKNRDGMAVLKQRLHIEFNIREDILQVAEALGMLQISDTGTEALLSVRCIDIILQNCIFIVEEMIIDLGFQEQGHIGLSDPLGLIIIVHGLPLLPHNTKVLDQLIECFRTVVIEHLGFQSPELGLLDLLELQILVGHHVMGIPDLLEPAAEHDALLIDFNGFLVLAEALEGLGEIEMGADIGGLFLQLFLEHGQVTGEFVGLAATVVAVIDP